MHLIKPLKTYVSVSFICGCHKRTYNNNNHKNCVYLLGRLEVHST